MAFHVGVSGHLDLAGSDLAGLRKSASDVFAAIADAVLALHTADQANAAPLYQPELPRLRCLCGLAENADAILVEAALAEGWDLVAVLPFARDEYAEDFTGRSLDEHRRLLASAVTVCSLGCNRAGGMAYAAVGEQIIEQSDLLVTIWDGLPARGPGGTGEIIRHAARRGLPVAVLPPSGADKLSWLAGGSGDIAGIAQAALLPPSGDVDSPHAYLAERSRGARWAGSAVRFYETVVTLGASQSALPTATAGPDRPQIAVLDQAFAWADRLATEYAARYRAAGLMRYGLIIPATIASLVGWYGDGWQQAAGNLADFAILLFIVRFSARGWWEPAHARFTAYRALAEYLRNAELLAPLGAAPPIPGAASRQHRAADWTAWYSRALVRQQGPASANFDPQSVAGATRFIRHKAAGQIEFLLRRASRFEVMARRLTRAGVTLSLCGIAFSGIRAVMLLAGVGATLLRGFNEMALVLPAMAPVFLGLSSFNEYRMLSTRYRAAAAELQTQVAALDEAPPQRAAVLSIARRIAEVMLAETAEWQSLIKARRVSAH